LAAAARHTTPVPVGGIFRHEVIALHLEGVHHLLESRA
jgi:hypothetical protein